MKANKRPKWAWLLIAVGTFMAANGIIAAFVANFTTGNILETGVGALLLLWGVFYEQIQAVTSKGAARVAKWVLAVGMALYLGICVFFGVYGNIDTVTYDEDVLIVLGCGVNGTVPTEPLQARLEKALDYIKKNPDVKIAVTGGQGPQEDISEAECMANYLAVRTIEPSRIILEDKSTSTGENFKFTKPLLDKKLGENYKAAVITNDFHILRAKLLAKENGMEITTLHANSKWYNAVMMYMREVLAMGKYLIFKE